MSVRIEELPDGGTLTFDPHFLPAEEAAALHDHLTQELAWETRAIVLFGREVLQPRLIAWGGDVEYRYSGQTLERRPLSPAVAATQSRVSDAAGVTFNHVLLNRYRDERDSMGLHSDDEPELGQDPVVATLSLGAARTFVIVPRRAGSHKVAYELTPGSLLIMNGACQRNYRHGIPKATQRIGERISLTFRRVVTRAARDGRGRRP